MYVQALRPLENPAERRRGPVESRPAQSSHVAVSPIYNGARFRQASRNESKTKIRSNRRTTAGAVTIDSLHAIPSAHESTARRCHRLAARAVRARTLAYSVRR